MRLGPNSILPPKPVTGLVKLAPAYSALSSIALLEDVEESEALGEWVVQTLAKLDEETLERQHIISWGLGPECLANAIDQDISDLDFPTYLRLLKETDPIRIRDKIWHSRLHSPHVQVLIDEFPEPDAKHLLSDKDKFVDFFITQFKGEGFKKKLSSGTFEHTYELMQNPVQLRDFVVDHLTGIWESYLEAEWANIFPILQDVVDAFQTVDLDNLPVFEMIQKVTRRDIKAIFKEEELLKFRQILFVPSVHNGPYIMWAGNQETLWLTFSAHLPKGQAVNEFASQSAALLNQSELLNRLKALADENRIQILNALKDGEQLSTQDIMARFRLSKSAASRHLRQLRANSIIDEIRGEDGVKKFYRLNPANGKRTLASLADLIG